MKILQINNYHYLKGGSERVYFETSRLLEENGHKVIHFSVNDKEALESPCKGYFIEPSNYFGRNFIQNNFIYKFIYSKEARYKLEDLIKREKPDIAHLHIFYGRLTSSILPVLKRYNVPVVMTIHEYKMLCPMYTFLNDEGKICEKCATGNYYHCVVRKCNRSNVTYSSISALECYIRDKYFPYERYIDKFIMVSKFLMDKHLQYKPQLRDKTVQIYNFVNMEKYTSMHLQGDYYLYFGRLSREKGILTLLEAWKHFPGIRLKIVGNGSLKNEIIKYIQENNINAELVGYLTGQELFEVIRDSKYVIIPSEWYETFGLNIVEGFACGRPVLASKIGAIPELVQDKMNGFLFESKNINSLIETVKLAETISEDEYKELSYAARGYAETYFDKEIYYKKLTEVYNEITSNVC